jgi:hypothetical protein
MAIGIYDTITLVQSVELMKRPSQFLLDTFFPRIQTSETQKVAIDVFANKRRMAPFCSPLVEGKVMESLGYTTNEFAPAYIKMKAAIDPFRPVRRMIGEQIGGQQMSPAERELANLQFDLEQHIIAIDRRLEWMAAQALFGGSVTIAGDGFPSTVINFGRDSSLSVTLTGGSRWGQTGIYPSESIDDTAALVLKASGLVVTDIVFTSTPWKLFRKDQNVKDVIASPQNGNPSLGVEGSTPKTGAQFKGNWGNYRLWLYMDWFIDPADNTEKPMLADGSVILGSDMMMGERAFASVIDPEFSYQALPYAPKSWVEKDPAQRWVMVQSSPLVIPSAVNGAAAMTVI